jgi:WXG100 family type VII secretion target
MSQIKISPEQVRHVAEQFRQASGQSQDVVSRLGAQVSGMESEWAGATKAKFYAEFVQWDSKMREFVNLLANIGRQLDEIATNFEEADNRNAMVGAAVHRGPGGPQNV